MNTAPQDDYSGDLARDLSGWSDDALLKELSRRTTITTDADHELISTGAGMHLQHRAVSGPTVTYDSDAEQWTIIVPDFACQEVGDQFIDGAVDGALDPKRGDVLGKFKLSGGTYVFDKYSSNYSVEFVINQFATSSVAIYNTVQSWRASIDTADACTDGATLLWESPHGYRCGLNRRMWSIYLKSDGGWELNFPSGKLDFAGPSRRNSHPFLDYQGPSTRALVLHNMMVRNGDPHSLGTDAGIIVPVSTDDNIILAYESVSGTSAFGLVSVLHNPPTSIVSGYSLLLGRITTDADGVCTRLSDYTGHLQQPFYEGYTGSIPSTFSSITVEGGIITGYS